MDYTRKSYLFVLQLSVSVFWTLFEYEKMFNKKSFLSSLISYFWKTKLKNYNNIEKKNVKKILIPPFFTPPHPFCYSFLNVISESPSLPFHVICQAGFRRYGLQIELKHSLHSTGYMCNTWFYNLIRLPFIYRVNNFIFRIKMFLPITCSKSTGSCR